MTIQEAFRTIVSIDFDGVLHSYAKGWQGSTTIDDIPVKGAMTWLYTIVNSDEFDVYISSSRNSHPHAIEAMKVWLHTHLADWLESKNVLSYREEATKLVNKITFATEKPPAALHIDDRAIQFKGTFPSARDIKNFKPWRSGDRPQPVEIKPTIALPLDWRKNSSYRSDT